MLKQKNDMLEMTNLPDIIKGDTFRDIRFTMSINGVIEDLTNYSIACKFRKGSKTGMEVKSLSIGSGITLTDASNGIFTINAFDLDWGVGVYYYDVEFTDGSSVIDTYIMGQLMVKQDVTY